MRQHFLFLLLLVTVVALADDRPKAQHATGGAEAQPKTEAAQARTEHAQSQTQEAQNEEVPRKTKAAQGRTEQAQAKTEKGQTQTEEAQATTEADAKLESVPGGKALGMSVLGNQEAPKSLVIVPWKTSELGRSPGISPMLDDSRQPVDKEVFMRALRYYEIRSGTKP
jgi:hypothetical protein